MVLVMAKPRNKQTQRFCIKVWKDQQQQSAQNEFVVATIAERKDNKSKL
jgi:hypothetical protein